MFNSRFSSLLTVLLIIAIVAIIGILGFLGYSMYNKYYINSEARDAVDAFQEAVGNTTKVTPKQDENIIDGNLIIGGVEETNSIYTGVTSSGSGKKTTYNGYTVVGTISIPTIKIEYPVLEKVTTKSLKVAVAYLSGPGINQVGNTVIQGHNYRNGLFFSNISKLSNGDDIYLTDTTGTKIRYKVYRNFTAAATDASFYNRDTEGKREITLSTCTEDAQVRTIIFAREV